MTGGQVSTPAAQMAHSYAVLAKEAAFNPAEYDLDHEHPVEFAEVQLHQASWAETVANFRLESDIRTVPYSSSRQREGTERDVGRRTGRRSESRSVWGHQQVDNVSASG